MHDVGGPLAAVPGAVPRGTPVEQRLMGHARGPRPGATLICVVGIHGNEPAGVHAARRVLASLAGRDAHMRGDFVVLAGNLAALRAGRRYIDRDLNRAWTDERIAELRGGPARAGTVEDREQLELLAAIDAALAETRGPVYVLDLHTTSGPGGVFSAFTDALPQRAFAENFPVPMILGLEEQVDGTLLNLLSAEGLISITVETGQHDEPAAIDRAEATIWLALVGAGLLSELAAPEAALARKLLHRDAGHLPRVMEMRYRHPVEDGDRFRMDAGYANFDAVKRGQAIASDRNGRVVVGEISQLLMPLYQEQGEDGYFLVRAIDPFWLHVSEVLRRARVSRVAHWLPGVHRMNGAEDHVVVDKRVARFFAKQLFHLLGYREVEDVGARLVMRRRPFDEARYLEAMPAPHPIGEGGGDEPTE
jgi:succinylglutamate desuccinylase